MQFLSFVWDKKPPALTLPSVCHYIVLGLSMLNLMPDFIVANSGFLSVPLLLFLLNKARCAFCFYIAAIRKLSCFSKTLWFDFFNVQEYSKRCN